MELHLTGRNIELTPALKTFAQDKLQRIKHRFNSITEIHVVFQIENVTHIAEATVHLDGSEIHATAEAIDMYSAMDKLIDKLLSQITKLKEKQIDRR